MTPLELEAALLAVGTAPPAVLGAVASRYLAVGTPRSFGIVGDGGDDLEAHRVWFAPTDIRTARSHSVDEILAADIVCIHTPLAVSPSQLRRGTHVNAVARIDIPGARVADVTELAQMAAGFVDGRQLDEITIFLALPAVLA